MVREGSVGSVHHKQKHDNVPCYLRKPITVSLAVGPAAVYTDSTYTHTVRCVYQLSYIHYISGVKQCPKLVCKLWRSIMIRTMTLIMTCFKYEENSEVFHIIVWTVGIFCEKVSLSKYVFPVSQHKTNLHLININDAPPPTPHPPPIITIANKW